MWFRTAESPTQTRLFWCFGVLVFSFDFSFFVIPVTKNETPRLSEVYVSQKRLIG